MLEERHITNSSGDLLSSEVKYGQGTSYQPVQSLIYDLAGRPVSQTQYGVTTTLAYDNDMSGSDQVWSSSIVGVDPTYRRYDSRGQQTWVSDSHEFNSPDTIRWSYDALGRVTSESVLNGNKEVPRLWTYEGNSVVYTNRNGWVTTTTTDIANKTITETSTHPTNGPQNTPLTFSQVTELYSTGSIAGLSNKEGTTQLADYQYTYDALGRVRNQTSQLGMLPGKTLSFDYLYSSYNPTEKTWETTRTIKENGTDLITTKNIANALGQVTKIRETATSASKLNSKSVDFLFNGEMLEEIKRYNNGAGTGTFVSNTPIKYNANRKVSEITHYANGIADNVSKQEIRYTPNGQIQDVSNQEGSNPKRTLIHTRNQDGSVGKVTSIDETSGSQKEKPTVYNSDAMVSGKKETLGRIKEDGNGRYVYDKEGNVTEHQRFVSPENTRVNLDLETYYDDSFTAYGGEASKSSPSSVIGAGNFRLFLSPLRIESTKTVITVTITAQLREVGGIFAGAVLAGQTFNVPVVNIGENMYAVIESKSWDINISGPDATKELYVSFEIDLNIESTLDPSKIYGSLSLDRFDDKHIFEYDASNRIIFAKLIATNDSGPFVFSTTRYKYDALGQMISREVKSQGQVLDDSTFIYEQGNPVLEYDDVGRLERASLYAQNLDLLLATDDLDFDGTSQTAETVWVQSDYQGTVTGLYVSADRYKRVSYDDYGRPHNTTSSILDETHLNETYLYHIVRFGYLGMYYDIDTHLYSDGTRPYDSTSGRYLTASGLGSGVNYVYSFANNTPVDRTTAAVSFGRNSSIPSYWSGFAFGAQASQNAQWIRDTGDYIASKHRNFFHSVSRETGSFDAAFTAEYGAKVINFGAALLSILADPRGFLEGIYHHGAEYNRAGGGGINGSVLAVSGTLGLTGLVESVGGVDILTAEALNGDERFDRGMIGVSSALTLAGSPGLFATGRSLLAQAAKMGPKINLVPRALSHNISKLSNRVAQAVGKWQNGNAPSRTVVGAGFDAKGILPRNGKRTVLNQGPNPTCGPTSCGMILDDIAGGRQSTNIVGYKGVGPEGIAIDDLLPILNNNGVKATYKSRLTIDALKAATSKGNPAIVAIKTPNGGHAVVVDGITKRMGKQVVAIRNPWGKQYFQTVEEFRKVYLRQGIITGN